MRPNALPRQIRCR